MDIQGDQKVSVHLMMYCNRQVHRDFLITLYKYIHPPKFSLKVALKSRNMWLKDVNL